VQNYIHRLPPAEVIGIDHIYLTVSDLTLSERFYDQVLVEILGFRKSRFVLSNDEHLNYFNRHFGYVRLYPEYAPDYWATFFTDPDGLRLEVTNYRQERRSRHDQWNVSG